MQKLDEQSSFFVACLVSSLLFAAIHVPGWLLLHMLRADRAVFVFLFGIVLGIVLRDSRSLWAVIVAHSLERLSVPRRVSDVTVFRRAQVPRLSVVRRRRRRPTARAPTAGTCTVPGAGRSSQCGQYCWSSIGCPHVTCRGPDRGPTNARPQIASAPTTRPSSRPRSVSAYVARGGRFE